MQSCKFDFKIDFLQHWANHAFKGARSITKRLPKESSRTAHKENAAQAFVVDTGIGGATASHDSLDA